MYSIQQAELFSFEELMNFQAEQKYAAILEGLPIEKILHAIGKGSHLGRPERNNTRAMVYSLFISKLERIVFTKDLIRRLRSDAAFRWACRFTDSDRIPSPASYSRLVTKLSQCGVLQRVQEWLVQEAIHCGFIRDVTLAMDSSHVEAYDVNPALIKKQNEPSLLSEVAAPTVELVEQPSMQPTEKPQKPKRNKRGAVPKAEREEWQRQVEAYEATLTSFEVDLGLMLNSTYEGLLADLPQDPSNGGKGDPRGSGRMMFWYGYKANLIVDTRSQYIVSQLFSSGHVSDQRMAIITLKQFQRNFPTLSVNYVLADKGYDALAVYQQIHALGAFPLIPVIHRHKDSLPEGMNEHFQPVCKQNQAYQYDSYDPKYKTIKFTRPKACQTCPFQDEACQRVYKIRIEQDVRRYTAPARGSEKFKELFKQRTAVERVFSYLKLYLGLGATRKRKKRALLDYELSCLTYNLCRFALDRLNRNLTKHRVA